MSTPSLYCVKGDCPEHLLLKLNPAGFTSLEAVCGECGGQLRPGPDIPPEGAGAPYDPEKEEQQ